MTTQEMIFDYLKVQGLVPEYDEDKDIRFKYQMRNFVVSNYPDDRQFLQIMMPFIFDVTAENRVAALEACNKINLSKKIVKAVVMGEGVFLMTEVLLDETPEPSVMVPRMLDMLVGAQQSFYDTLRELPCGISFARRSRRPCRGGASVCFRRAVSGTGFETGGARVRLPRGGGSGTEREMFRPAPSLRGTVRFPERTPLWHGSCDHNRQLHRNNYLM